MFAVIEELVPRRLIEFAGRVRKLVVTIEVDAEVFLAKGLQIFEEDPEVFAAMAHWQLTRSTPATVAWQPELAALRAHRVDPHAPAPHGASTTSRTHAGGQ